MPPARKKLKTESEPRGEEIKNISKLQKCQLCKRGNTEYLNLNAGKFYKLQRKFYHYHCLLFSHGINQTAEDVGILGYKNADIEKLLKKTSKCEICNETGATISCLKKTCKGKFHFPCGASLGFQFIINNLRSNNTKVYCLCSQHMNKQTKQPGKTYLENCLICFEDFPSNEAAGPFKGRICCNTCGGVYHTDCVQRLAHSYGMEGFKCPHCNNSNDFKKVCIEQGIFIQEKDMEVENDPLYNWSAATEFTCVAKYCWALKKNPDRGRNLNIQGSEWELTPCNTCRHNHIHNFCGRLNRIEPDYDCEVCAPEEESESGDESDVASDESDDNDEVQKILQKKENIELSQQVFAALNASDPSPISSLLDSNPPSRASRHSRSPRASRNSRRSSSNISSQSVTQNTESNSKDEENLVNISDDEIEILEDKTISKPFNKPLGPPLRWATEEELKPEVIPLIPIYFQPITTPRQRDPSDAAPVTEFERLSPPCVTLDNKDNSPPPPCLSPPLDPSYALPIITEVHSVANDSDSENWETLKSSKFTGEAEKNKVPDNGSQTIPAKNANFPKTQIYHSLDSSSKPGPSCKPVQHTTSNSTVNNTRNFNPGTSIPQPLVDNQVKKHIEEISLSSDSESEDEKEVKLPDISHLEFVKPGRVPTQRQDDDEIQIIADVLPPPVPFRVIRDNET